MKKKFKAKVSKDLVNLFKDLRDKREGLISCVRDVKRQEHDLWKRLREEYKIPDDIRILTLDHEKCEVRSVFGED